MTTIRPEDRLLKGAKQAKTLEQFVYNVQSFPRWFLVTAEQKKMTKQDLRAFYLGLGKSEVQSNVC